MPRKLKGKLFFIIPAFFSLIINLNAGIDWAWKDFFENLLTATLVVVIVFSILNNKWRLFFAVSVYLLFTISALVENSYYMMYRNTINMSVIYILMETNSNETAEFLRVYFRYIYLVVILMVIPLFIIVPFFFKWNKEFKPAPFHLKSKESFIKIIIVLVVVSTIGLFQLQKYNLVYTTMKGFFQYRKEMKRYEKYSYTAEGGKFTGVSGKYSGKEIYVLVIGESANRDHLNLYGYERKTNPYLAQINNELVVYKDIISPFANTISSLPLVLSPGNYENPDARFDGVITQLFNHAHFETYWLSNQEPLGLRETYITKIAKSCKQRFFMNTMSNREKAPYDSILFHPMQRILNQPFEKKFIIVHLLGSHVDYIERYPSSFNKFSNIPVTKLKSPEAYKTINEYDNSILYTDFVVSKIIEMVKLKDARSFVLYFSDHGEDVYETSDKSYHADGIKSRFMYEIPFVLWTSEKFMKTADSLVFEPHRPFMTDDLIYGISNLAGIYFNEFQPGRSIFNKEFKHRKRLILNGIDYDAELKKNN
ncbi:MAG: phosphoethanolamine transferase [Bacteroidales bacterium]